MNMQSHLEELQEQKKNLEAKQTEFDKERKAISDMDFALKIKEAFNRKQIRLIEKEIKAISP